MVIGIEGRLKNSLLDLTTTANKCTKLSVRDDVPNDGLSNSSESFLTIVTAVRLPGFYGCSF